MRRCTSLSTASVFLFFAFQKGNREPCYHPRGYRQNGNRRKYNDSYTIESCLRLYIFESKLQYCEMHYQTDDIVIEYRCRHKFVQIPVVGFREKRIVYFLHDKRNYFQEYQKCRKKRNEIAAARVKILRRGDQLLLFECGFGVRVSA